MNRIALALAFVFSLGWVFATASGCKKESAKNRDAVSPPGDLALPVPSTDDVWALAPAGTVVGVVVAPTTGTTLLGAVEEVRRSMSEHPIGARVLEKMRADMPEDMPKNVLDKAFHDQLGLDLGRPAAVFMTEPENDDTVVLIAPIADPKKLVAFAEGTRDEAAGVDVIDDMRCKQIAGHYACAKTDEMLAKVGADSSLKKTIAALPDELRGHIEVYLDSKSLPGDMSKVEEAFSDLGAMHGALRLERGGFAANWHMVAKPAHPIAKAATEVSDTLARRVANKNPAGFTRVSVPFKALVPPDVAEKMVAGAKRINIDAKDDILDNLTGEVLVYSLAQRGLGLVVEFGAKDGRRLQRAIDFMCGLAQMQLPEKAKQFVMVEKSGDRCKAKLDPKKMGELLPPDMPFTESVEVEAYTTDISLAISFAAETRYESNEVVASPSGRDLLTGSWNLAMWGYGSFSGLFQPGMLDKMRELPNMKGESFEDAMFAMWMLGHLTEMGMGAGVRADGVHATLRVGTQWANDDTVLREFQSLLKQSLAGDKGTLDTLKAMSDKAPNSPLGRSVRAGTGSGPMVALSVIGVAAAVAIPAFLKYKARSRSALAPMMLHKLHMGARMYAMTEQMSAGSLAPSPASAPKESVGPTPPLGACCDQGGTCQPDASLWQHPTWTKLQFSVDEPHAYSYQYEVDESGKNFTVRALGDLDCDGVYSTFEMSSTVADDGQLIGDSEMRRINEME